MRPYRKTDVAAALKTLGVEELRDWQKDVMTSVYQGEDLFLSVPTSGGKSLTFQLPAILEAGKALTVVFSPLRALQQDQVGILTALGVKAVLLNSDLSNKERKEILDNLSEYCLLYLAPEQLSAHDLRKALQECEIERVVVDEAHVLPQVAPSFRKAYRKIGDFIHGLPYPPQIVACTATATPKDRKTIIRSLRMDNPVIYTHPLRRDNLHLSVKKLTVSKKRKSKNAESESILFHAVEATLQEWNGEGSVIIYCPTVRRVKALKRWLEGRDWSSIAAYTGKMSQKDRLNAHEGFLSGSRKIIVATNAFGLGINKPDVRMVIHAGLPLTLDGYTQEIGRAGRDGKKSKCVLFYFDAEFKRNENILKQSGKKKAIRHGTRGLNALKKLLNSSKCLWSGIGKYYGQRSAGSCKHCCRCKAKEARK